MVCLSLALLLWLLCLPTITMAQGQPFLPPKLSFDYQHPKPETFVVERSLDAGVTWPQIAQLPGQRGKGLTWEDTTLAPMTARMEVRYRVRAKRGGAVSKPSNEASTTLGPPPPGECVVSQPSPKVVVTVCTLQ